MSWFFSQSEVKEIDVAETRRRSDDKAALLVDVREAEEVREGRIPGSRHIPLGQIPASIMELLDVPEVIFVCRSGQRSASATAALTRAGHANAYNMVGGMIDWQRAGYPVQQ